MMHEIISMLGCLIQWINDGVRKEVLVKLVQGLSDMVAAELERQDEYDEVICRQLDEANTALEANKISLKAAYENLDQTKQAYKTAQANEDYSKKKLSRIQAEMSKVSDERLGTLLMWMFPNSREIDPATGKYVAKVAMCLVVRDLRPELGLKECKELVERQVYGTW